MFVCKANFKLDRHVSKTTVKERVDYIVSTLGLGKILNTRLSVLSGGERKKIALAVQLLNDPPILFCDEITTGLDSYSAAHIVNALKAIARTGKIVICTIHQPASGVFDKFDEVVLLSNGRLAYQGPVTLVNQFFQKYCIFKTIRHYFALLVYTVISFRFNYECPDMYNKADFIISILNSDSEKVKTSVDEMCKLSSTDKQMYLNYDSFNDPVNNWTFIIV